MALLKLKKLSPPTSFKSEVGGKMLLFNYDPCPAVLILYSAVLDATKGFV